jgi:hypothetical protein
MLNIRVVIFIATNLSNEISFHMRSPQVDNLVPHEGPSVGLRGAEQLEDGSCKKIGPRSRPRAFSWTETRKFSRQVDALVSFSRKYASCMIQVLCSHGIMVQL